MSPAGAPSPGLVSAIPSLRLAVPTELPAVAEQQARLAAFLLEAGIPAPLAARAELVFEEVVVNVIRHGFADEAARDAARVTVEASVTPSGAFTLVFEDSGRAFDPTQAALPGPARSLEEARIGGLGLPLIHRMAAALAYRRLEPEGLNRLTVVFGEAG